MFNNSEYQMRASVVEAALEDVSDSDSGETSDETNDFTYKRTYDKRLEDLDKALKGIEHRSRFMDVRMQNMIHEDAIAQAKAATAAHNSLEAHRKYIRKELAERLKSHQVKMKQDDDQIDETMMAGDDVLKLYESVISVPSPTSVPPANPSPAVEEVTLERAPSTGRAELVDSLWELVTRRKEEATEQTCSRPSAPRSSWHMLYREHKPACQCVQSSQLSAGRLCAHHIPNHISAVSQPFEFQQSTCSSHRQVAAHTPVRHSAFTILNDEGSETVSENSISFDHVEDTPRKVALVVKKEKKTFPIV
jgi:hypothetical protein